MRRRGHRSGRGVIKTQQVLEKIEIGRDGAIQVCTEAQINSPEYAAASQVTVAIDELAGHLTGDQSYFHLGNHGNPRPEDPDTKN